MSLRRLERPTPSPGLGTDCRSCGQGPIQHIGKRACLTAPSAVSRSYIKGPFSHLGSLDPALLFSPPLFQLVDYSSHLDPSSNFSVNRDSVHQAFSATMPITNSNSHAQQAQGQEGHLRESCFCSSSHQLSASWRPLLIVTR